MSHRGNDRSEGSSSRRRRDSFEDGDYRHSSSNKSRSRWDDRDRDLRDPKRGDAEGARGTDTSEKSRSRWDSGGPGGDIGRGRSGGSSSKSKYEGEGERYSKRDDRRSRSRSRSKSPFSRRNGDDYSGYSNPSRSDHREGVVSNHSSGIVTGNNPQSKPSSWSDSSDEEDYKGRSGSSKPSEISMKPSPGLGHLDSASGNGDGNKSNPSSSGGLCLKLTAPGSSSKSTMPLPKILSVSAPVKSAKVASVFNDDDDDEPEEMPAECKMRMKNVGRETKTSEGPNSFGKTKIGFCNLSHLTEKRLEGKGAAAAKKS